MTGEEFKNLRIEAGLTQARLGELTNIDGSRIRRIESGTTSLGNLTVTNAVRLARALGVSVEAFADDRAYICGAWWNDKSIDLVNIHGEVYALHGWNGEVWLNCWKCSGEYFMEASEEEFTIRPVYEEVSKDEFEIVDYEI